MQDSYKNYIDAKQEKLIESLLQACYQNDIERVENLLKNKQLDINALNHSGQRNALMAAISKGYVELAEKLIKAGADVNQCNHYGDNALHIAASQGRLKCIELLLRYNADLDKRSQLGRTPVAEASVLKHPSVLQALLQAGANPNISDNSGRSPLILAANALREKSVDLLLKYNANIAQQTQDGKNALSILWWRTGPVYDNRARDRILSNLRGAMEKYTHIEDLAKQMQKSEASAAFNSVSVDLVQAAASNRFGAYLSHTLKAGSTFDLDTFVRPNKEGISVLDVLKQKGTLHLLWRRDLWQDQKQDLHRLYETALLPWEQAVYKDDIRNLMTQINLAHVKSQAQMLQLKRRPRNTHNKYPKPPR